MSGQVEIDTTTSRVERVTTTGQVEINTAIGQAKTVLLRAESTIAESTTTRIQTTAGTPTGIPRDPGENRKGEILNTNIDTKTVARTRVNMNEIAVTNMITEKIPGKFH